MREVQRARDKCSGSEIVRLRLLASLTAPWISSASFSPLSPSRSQSSFSYRRFFTNFRVCSIVLTLVHKQMLIHICIFLGDTILYIFSILLLQRQKKSLCGTPGYWIPFPPRAPYSPMPSCEAPTSPSSTLSGIMDQVRLVRDELLTFVVIPLSQIKSVQLNFIILTHSRL